MFRLKEGKENAYREAHKRVWPELIEAARVAGLKNHSVFIKGSVVFAYAESENLHATMSLLASAAVTRRWDEAMAVLMGDPESEALEEVCHFL
jgi:L-rhamnose mutarotase